MESNPLAVKQTKKIALVGHDNKKHDLIAIDVCGIPASPA